MLEINVKSMDQKSYIKTSPNCELEPIEGLFAPPRRKFHKSGSLRRTDRSDTFDTNDNPLLGSDQNQSQNQCLSHPCDVTIVETKCHENELKDEDNVELRSENLRDSSSQCLSADLSAKVEKSYANKAPNDGIRTSVAIQVMERIRRLRSRWFTSHEAKASRSRRLNRFIYYVKVFLTHLFSTTGLCLLVIAYSCVGAFIFKYLEHNNELKQINKIQTERIRCTEDLWNYTSELNVLYPEKWKNYTKDKLKKFEEKIVKAVREDGYDGDEGNHRQWTFSGALLYSVTVITTIGYGNVTCKTSWGRIVTMIYALIGIPVMFLCLANLGNLMAETFRFSYKRLCCICFCCCDRVSTKYNTDYDKSSHKSKNEKLEMKSCGQKDYIQSEKEMKVIFSENDDQKVRPLVAVTPSAPPTPSVISSQSSSPSKSFPSTPVRNDLNQSNHDMIVIKESIVKIDDNMDRVPIWLVIVLVISYIMAGAVMFSIWEKDWGPLEGAYFCFTTLTTIGFGDLVPGSAKYSDNTEEQTKFIICCAYLIVGLSLLAMSFNLVQEEIVIKSKEIGRRMGIIPQQSHEYNKSTSV